MKLTRLPKNRLPFLVVGAEILIFLSSTNNENVQVVVKIKSPRRRRNLENVALGGSLLLPMQI